MRTANMIQRAADEFSGLRSPLLAGAVEVMGERLGQVLVERALGIQL